MRKNVYMGNVPESLSLDDINLFSIPTSKVNQPYSGLPETWGNDVNSQMSARLPLLESMLKSSPSALEKKKELLREQYTKLTLLTGDILGSNSQINAVANYFVDRVGNTVRQLDIHNYSTLDKLIEQGVEASGEITYLLDIDNSKIDCNYSKDYLELVDNIFGNLEDLKILLDNSSFNTQL